LIEIARTKGQQHLLAISKREAISPTITDAIVKRGERVVVRSVARNVTATFSEQGYSSLVQRAADDGVLAVAVGQREDLPAPLLQQLLSEAADLVRRKIFEAASPEQKTKLARTMVEMSADGTMQSVQRDFAAAQRAVAVLHKAGRLNQDALVRFARDRKYEEAVVALAAISGLLEWATVRALLALRLPPGRALSAVDAETARASFERLALPTAQRVMKFWKERPPQA
jgi:uncharacterized protein (DUF2336 family)